MAPVLLIAALLDRWRAVLALALIAALAGGAIALHRHGVKQGRAEVRALWLADSELRQAEREKALRAAEQAQAEARAESARRAAAQQAIVDDAIAQARRSAQERVAADAAGQRLRERTAALAARCGGTGGHPGAAAPGTPAPSPGDLLADVQRRIDEAAGQLAATADARGAAGSACERAYLSLERNEE